MPTVLSRSTSDHAIPQTRVGRRVVRALAAGEAVGGASTEGGSCPGRAADDHGRVAVRQAAVADLPESVAAPAVSGAIRMHDQAVSIARVDGLHAGDGGDGHDQAAVGGGPVAELAGVVAAPGA